MFAILGPVRVGSGITQVAVTARRELILLGMLLLHANSSVSVAALVEAIWGGQPPVNARNQVQQCVRQVRRRLVEAGVDRSVIHTEPGGYRAVLDTAELDLHEFRRLVDQARSHCAAGQPAQARDSYRAALALWRGPALPDLDSDPIRQAAATLDQEHTQVIEERLNVELDLGAAGELVPELTNLVSQHPYRERLHHALMLALYRAGRQADALAAYQRARRLLCNELGVEPGQPLQQLHHDILHHHPQLQPAPQPPTPQQPATVVPRELPADITGFTGRSQELRLLDSLVPEGENPTGPVVISAIDGMAGIGKTALAVHAAHQLAGRYPDGQLFLDLHGYTQGLQPLAAGEVLERILRTLGIPGERIPADLDQRAALYRSRLADQKLLILLDNAATETQITPLLPGTPGCLVIVTSRRRLTGLDATHTVSLDTLPLADAVTLFTRTVGDARLAHEPPELVAEVVELCGRLPLAIRIAAARLRTHPSWRLTHLIGRLRRQQHRLAELDTGQRSITAALDLSYQQLAPDQQHLYRLLGLHPGPDIEPYAAAALTCTTLNQATHLLEQLHHTHVLQEPVPNRYRFHDLIRAHATHTATTEEPEPNRREALTRLLNHYLHTADAAVTSASPVSARLPVPDDGSLAAMTLGFRDSGQALAWLDAERRNLVAAVHHAATHGPQPVAWRLADVLRGYFVLIPHAGDWLSVAQAGLSAATATGDQLGLAAGQLNLAHLCFSQSRSRDAIDHAAEALSYARAAGWVEGQGTILNLIGCTHWNLGELPTARDYLTQSVAVFERAGLHDAAASYGSNLARVTIEMGRLAEAAKHAQRALAATQGRDPVAEALNLVILGHVHLAMGRRHAAVDFLTRALDLSRVIGNRSVESDALINLAAVHRDQADPSRAAELADAALALAREHSLHRHEVDCVNFLAEFASDPVSGYELALAMARETGSRYYEAEVLIGLATAHLRLESYTKARSCAIHAIALTREMGYRLLEGLALTSVAAIELAAGSADQATAQGRQALAIHRDTGHRLGEARTLLILGRVAAAACQHSAALDNQQEASAIFADLGIPAPDPVNLPST